MKMSKTILVVLLALLLALTTACGADSLLIGKWTDSTNQMEMTFDKEGNVIMTAYGIPLPATYEYEGDTLTVIYSEDLVQTGTLTFFGDNEFCWENTDSDGAVYQDYYTRVE